jgi:type IV pilus assembly protein PilC
VDDVIRKVRKGADLTSSFAEHEENFPPLFLDLLNVGEQTGSLPEVFASLATYYEARVERAREFRSTITWPVIQLFAAIVVIGLLIYLLGMLGTKNMDGTDMDILGIGLTGTRGAITWFVLCFGTIGGGWIAYKLTSRTVAGLLLLDPMLLSIPVLGKCLRSFAIARFAWCFALTQQAGMSIKPSLQSSLKATANGAFIASIPIVWNELKEGETLADSLAVSKLFPIDFIHFVDTAEQTGTVPETLDRMSHVFDEDAHRAMKTLTVIMARGIWALVALFIIFFIFRLIMVIYINPLNDALKLTM